MVTAPPQMSSPLTGSVDLSRINSIRLATTRQTYDAAPKFVLSQNSRCWEFTTAKR